MILSLDSTLKSLEELFNPQAHEARLSGVETQAQGVFKALQVITWASRVEITRLWRIYFSIPSPCSDDNVVLGGHPLWCHC